jgi:hemerythrin-like metal-binding protein
MITVVKDAKIDAIHQEEILMLEELLAAIEGEDSVEITRLFSLFIEHMQMHFSHEESLMKERGYAMYTIHQAEHYKVLNEARYNLMLWKSSPDLWELREYFGEDFVAWIHQHIDAMDVPMIDFFERGE